MLQTALIVTSLLFGATATAYAEEVPATAGDESESLEMFLERMSENPLIDETQNKASDMLYSAAEWFDSFFDDSRISDEKNKSRAKLRLSLSYHDRDGWELNPSLRLRIHLPNLSKRTNLIIFAKEDPEDDTSQAVQGPNTSEDTLREDFAAGLQYFLKMGDKYNISTTFGGSFDYLYGGARFRVYKNLGLWQSRFVERVRYYTDDGWENYISLDFEREFLDHYLFRTTAQMYWREYEDSLDHSLTFQQYQFLSEKKAISYEWVNSFETDPSYRLKDLTLRLRYRQQFLREWLVYELTPRVNFPEEGDYEPEFGMTFTLEAKFGRLSGRKLKHIFQF